MTTRRQERVADLLQEEISDLLQRKVRDPRLEFVTVTAVKVSHDLRHARVYVSHLGSEEEQQAALAGLQHAAGFLRHELRARLSLRRVPELTFVLDESIERGQRILELLHQIEGS
ncbi:MAG TPA: 30S ribosome-binding factor RbfA [Anaerolineae bacterium]|nr:30S ribosome-binding factor RbfA [Anaerolineae bacterium]